MFLGICVLVLGIMFYIYIIKRHRNMINMKVQSLGGELIYINRCDIPNMRDPFVEFGKGRFVYKFEYKIDNNTDEGWVLMDIMASDVRWKI